MTPSRQKQPSEPTKTHIMGLPLGTNAGAVLDFIAQQGRISGLDEQQRSDTTLEMSQSFEAKKETRARGQQVVALRVWVLTSIFQDHLRVQIWATNDGLVGVFPNRQAAQQHLDVSVLELAKRIIREVAAQPAQFASATMASPAQEEPARSSAPGAPPAPSPTPPVVEEAPTAPPPAPPPPPPSPPPPMPTPSPTPVASTRTQRASMLPTDVSPQVHVDGTRISVTFGIGIRDGLGSPPPALKDEPRWVGPGEVVSIAGIEIPDAMVYVGPDGRRGARSDASGIINPNAEVSFDDPPAPEPSVGYWPTYGQLTKRQKGRYLRWLSGSRRGDLDDQTFLFLFLSGLERRVLSDMDVLEGVDQLHAIFLEVRRLADEHEGDGSFSHYSASFLEFIGVLLHAQGVVPPAQWAKPPRWMEFSMEFLVNAAVLDKQGALPSSDLALTIVRSHPESRLRTPARRCVAEFDELFKIRFEKRFPEGLPLGKKRADPVTTSFRPSSRGYNTRSFVFRRSCLGEVGLDRRDVVLEVQPETGYDPTASVTVLDLPSVVSMDNLRPELDRAHGRMPRRARKVQPLRG